MAESYRAYRRAWAAAGHPAEGLEVPALHFVHVADSELRARREPEQSAMWYFRTIARLIASESGPAPAEYEFYARARRHLGAVDYEMLYRDVLLFGDPSRVIGRIEQLRDELGVTYLLCWVNFGGLPRDLARDSIRRFAEKVMPRFR